MTDGDRLHELKTLTPRHWKERQAEPARHSHRLKAEEAFGESIVVRLCALAPKAALSHVGGKIDARNERVTTAFADVQGHLAAALELMGEVREDVGPVDREKWDRLELSLLQARVPAAALEAVFEVRRTDLPPPSKRNRGAPSLRARFVEQVAANLASRASAAALAHLGIAAGIDEPAKGERLKKVSTDYARLYSRALKPKEKRAKKRTGAVKSRR